MKEIPLALTYDDVLLVPQYSELRTRKEADLSGYVTPKIKLRVPLVSSNMMTVTEHAMAREMAKNGGIGIIHRFLTIEQHAKEVAKVKRSESLKIEDPYTIYPNQSAHDARMIMQNKGVNGLPVVDEQGMLLGLFTRRDLEAALAPHQLVEKLMTPRSELIVGNDDCNHDAAKSLMLQKRVEKLPLTNKEGKLCGLITMKDIRNQGLFPLATKDEYGRLRVGAAVGVKPEDIERALALEKAGVDFLCLDIAHGHSLVAKEMIQRLREETSLEIMAGNVATTKACEDLISWGANAIKAGIGGGSTCITRIVAGTGYPMISSLEQCAEVCRRLRVPLCADGGLRNSGDIGKALVFSDTCMLGGILAGCDESPGRTIRRKNGVYKVHQGMASKASMDHRKNMGNLEKPMQSIEVTYGESSYEQSSFQDAPAEGVEAVVPASGPTQKKIHDLAGGIRSAFSYSNAKTLEEFHENAKLVRITNAGLIESHPHDVEM